MDDGTVVDTENATEYWKERTRWNGQNILSVATGTEWDHQTLYRSRRGRYYIERTSQWQGYTPGAEWVSLRAAAAWLALNEHDIPTELVAVAEEVIE